ncbi:MAG TPA: membrane protein insertase YidC, partial [Rhodanobacter sp.]
MNQTRNFLLFALLAVAYLLFMAWEKDYLTPPSAPAASSVAGAASAPGVPNAQSGAPAINAVG